MKTLVNNTFFYYGGLGILLFMNFIFTVTLKGRFYYHSHFIH